MIAIADRGYDADWFRKALKHYGIQHCITPRNKRRTKSRSSKTLYNLCHHIESMFERIKDWRRIAMRYDRGAPSVFSTICKASPLRRAFLFNFACIG